MEFDYTSLPTVMMPRESINLRPSGNLVNSRIRQLQVTNIAPTLPAFTPVNVVRRITSATTSQVSIQIVRSPVQSLSLVTAQVQTPNGSLGASVSANSGGAMTLNIPRTAVPSALQIQGNSPTGQRSPLGFGNGVSRAINLA